MEFKEMYSRIAEYHSTLGYSRPEVCGRYIPLQQMRELCLATMMEVAELTNSLPWKPWREMASQEFDTDNAAREVIDIIFFLVGICETVGISAEKLEAKFHTVLLNNHNRIINGYSKKMNSDTSLCKVCGKHPAHIDGECVDCCH